jgi:hypothetical protein
MGREERAGRLSRNKLKLCTTKRYSYEQYYHINDYLSCKSTNLIFLELKIWKEGKSQKSKKKEDKEKKKHECERRRE